MYMMGYNEELSIPDGRKLRPLIPKPPSSPCHAPPHHFFAPYHHLAMAEQNASSVVVSSRWNPTPDQLRTLEELYRRGTRTPSADQIQHITAQLRRYGKIEGKNVFYWFQNHKARERQKRRRHFFDSHSPSPSPQLLDNIIMPKHDHDDAGLGGRVAGFQVEQNNNTPTPTPTHCTTSPPEMQEDNSRSTKAAEPYIHGWVQYDQRELQQHLRRRNATWHTIPATTARVTTSTTPTPTVPTKCLSNFKSTSFNNYQDYLNFFITHDHHHHRLLHPNTNTITDYDYDCKDDHFQTLELFPLRSENATATSTATCPAACTYNQKLMMMTDNSAMDATSFPPNYQFFEFLPLKN